MPETFLQQYESFLSSLTLYPALSKIKSVEMDLKGELNPSFQLDKLFFQEKKWLGFEQFYYYYYDQYKTIIKKELVLQMTSFLKKACGQGFTEHNLVS